MQAPLKTEFVIQQTKVEKNASSMPVCASLDAGASNHHRAMIQFGLAGTALGCILGTIAVPQIPRSEAMYTVILPLSTTYIGLALGFFVAGVRKRFKREGFVDSSLGGDGLVTKVIADFDGASAVLAALREAGVKARQIEIVGEDSDEFRDATSPLHRHGFDKLVLTLGGLGAAVGAYWGVIGCPDLGASIPSVVMSGIMASFCGSILGLLTGSFIGGILHLDNGPATDATIVEGSITDGVMAVSVRPDNEVQAAAIVRILNE